MIHKKIEWSGRWLRQQIRPLAGRAGASVRTRARIPSTHIKSAPISLQPQHSEQRQKDYCQSSSGVSERCYCKGIWARARERTPRVLFWLLRMHKGTCVSTRVHTHKHAHTHMHTHTQRRKEERKQDSLTVSAYSV